MSGNTENKRRQVFVNSNLLNRYHREVRMGFDQKELGCIDVVNLEKTCRMKRC